MPLFILAALLSASVLTVAAVFFFPGTLPGTVAILLLGTGYGALSFKRPRAALFVFCFCLPLFNSVLFSRHFHFFPPAALLFLFFFLGWLLRRIAQKDTTRLSTPLNAPLIAFSVLGFGSAVITLLRYAQFYPFSGKAFPIATINRLDENSLQAVTQVFLVATVFLAGPALFWTVLHTLKNRRDMMRALSALAAGIALSALFGIYQSLGNEALGNQPPYVALRRINATFLDPNSLGIFLGLALPPIAALVFTASRPWVRRTGIPLLAAALYVLFLSGSRTGILGLLITAVVVAIVCFLRYRSSARREIVFYLQPALAAFVLGLALWPVGSSSSSGSAGTILGERLSSSWARISARGAWSLLQSDRWPMWRRAIRVTAEYPVSGIGLGAYWFEIPNFLEWDPREPFFRDNANSYFLQVSAEMGGVGLILLLAILGIILVQSFRLALRTGHDPPGRMFAAALAGALCGVILLFSTGPHTDFMEIQGLFWLLAGMVFFWSCILEPAPPSALPGRQTILGFSPVRFRRVVGTMCAALVVIGLSGQIIHAFTDLSPSQRRKIIGFDFTEGFHAWETGDNGTLSRWTTADARTLLAREGPFLQFQIFVAHPDAAQKPVVVDIFLEGDLVHTEIFERPDESRRIRIPVPETHSTKCELRFRVSRTWRPARVFPGNTDSRDLGVLVSEIKFFQENRD